MLRLSFSDYFSEPRVSSGRPCWLYVMCPKAMCVPPQLCDCMDCRPPVSSLHGNSSGKNTALGCYDLLPGIFSTQGSNSPSPASLALTVRFFTTELPGKPPKGVCAFNVGVSLCASTWTTDEFLRIALDIISNTCKKFSSCLIAVAKASNTMLEENCCYHSKAKNVTIFFFNFWMSKCSHF